MSLTVIMRSSVVIPIYDNDPLEKSHRAYVTWSLIAINIAIFVVPGRDQRQGLDADPAQLRAVSGRGDRRGGDAEASVRRR